MLGWNDWSCDPNITNYHSQKLLATLFQSLAPKNDGDSIQKCRPSVSGNLFLTFTHGNLADWCRVASLSYQLIKFHILYIWLWYHMVLIGTAKPSCRIGIRIVRWFVLHYPWWTVVFFSHGAGSDTHLTKSLGGILPWESHPNQRTNDQSPCQWDTSSFSWPTHQYWKSDHFLSKCWGFWWVRWVSYRLMSGHQHTPPFRTRLRVQTAMIYDLWRVFKGILKQSQLQQATTKE